MTDQATVHVVDDDAAMRESLAFMLDSLGLSVRLYDGALAFLDDHDPLALGCLVLDVRMPGMTGLELVEDLKRRGSLLPVIIVTGHGDVPMAVRAMKAGALDFIEKPVNGMVLVERINEAIRLSRERLALASETGALTARLDGLTPREREVALAVAQGKQNKQIAHDLGISLKTVEIHRHNAMDKMAATTAADLTRMLVTLGLVEG
jgi:FixJ family two-component response regulator